MTRECCPGEGNHAGDCPTRCPSCEYSGGLHAYDCPDLPGPEAGDGPESGPAVVREHPAGPDPNRPQKEGSPVTLTNPPADDQPEAQDEKAGYRAAAELFHGEGIRSGDEMVRAMAQVQPVPFAGVRDALAEVEAELEAAG